MATSATEAFLEHFRMNPGGEQERGQLSHGIGTLALRTLRMQIADPKG